MESNELSFESVKFEAQREEAEEKLAILRVFGPVYYLNNDDYEQKISTSEIDYYSTLLAAGPIAINSVIEVSELETEFEAQYKLVLKQLIKDDQARDAKQFSIRRMVK